MPPVAQRPPAGEPTGEANESLAGARSTHHDTAAVQHRCPMACRGEGCATRCPIDIERLTDAADRIATALEKMVDPDGGGLTVYPW